jgi:hypothetical protein
VRSTPLARHRRIQVDQLANAIGYPLSDRRDDCAAVAVADQDHIVQVSVLEQSGNVRNVRVAVEIRAQQMGPLASPVSVAATTL